SRVLRLGWRARPACRAERSIMSRSSSSPYSRRLRAGYRSRLGGHSARMRVEAQIYAPAGTSEGGSGPSEEPIKKRSRLLFDGGAPGPRRFYNQTNVVLVKGGQKFLRGLRVAFTVRQGRRGFAECLEGNNVRS